MKTSQPNPDYESAPYELAVTSRENGWVWQPLPMPLRFRTREDALEFLKTMDKSLSIPPYTDV